jgi:hypothetical protein
MPRGLPRGVSLKTRFITSELQTRSASTSKPFFSANFVPVLLFIDLIPAEIQAKKKVSDIKEAVFNIRACCPI